MSQIYAPGDFVTGQFPVQSLTGAAVNADSPGPTILLYRGGIVTGVSISWANPSTGRYTWSCTIPETYAVGNEIRIEASVAVAGVVYPATPLLRCVLGLSPYTQSGVAQAGSGNTITLATSASTQANVYVGQQVRIYAGTGAGQVRTITAYSAGRVATVGRAWAVNPDNTSQYVVLADQSPVLSNSLGVTVSGYETNQDPATLVLATPANKLATDGTGQVTVGTIASAALASIWSIGSSTLTTAGSIGKRIVDFLTGDIFARLGAPAGGSIAADIAANQSAILNITQGTFLATDIPSIIERPDSGTESLIITLVIADETGAATNLDASANPALVLVDSTGTSQAGRLGAWSNPATGKYQITYTSSSTDGITRLRWEITGTINGKVRRYVQSTEIVDTTAVSFTAADRAAQAAIKAKTDLIAGTPAVPGDAMTLTSAYDPAKTAAPTVSAISTQIERAGGPLALTQTSAASADGKLTSQRLTNIDGLTSARLAVMDWVGSMIELVSSQRRWTANSLSQAPTGSGGGSAGTLLIALPTKLVAEGQVCPKGRLATIALQSGSSLAYGVQLVDSIGNGVPTGGTTLSAKIKDETGTLLSGLTVDEVLASEGRVTVLIDTRVSELADITYATLEVTRDNGDSDITTYPAQLFIER